MNSYSAWLEGYAATGERATAQYLGGYHANTFLEATRMASETKLGEVSMYYSVRNGVASYWGCRFFDNEADARRGFG